ncbi:NAD-dependent epimerase/dehydratase family protein [Pedobacter sp. SL55]|uniref:NAD-dependent epimerase/dehydratase family protein n=1 Tax=Pedobacter sp. SL55 TaxID=2995161 RepID=UPI002270CB9C|nr:NAD(P)-dependent oxidoreductase [Pedobacter sp. SL55]WAC42396.1 NAD(P)-dependent oxidoreductase [Pedobacter sp. SL55]
MSKKVLITGASGFVGYHLIVTAIENGLEVFAAIRPNSDVSHLKDLNVNYVNLNFNAVDELKAELEEKQYAYIIHAAGTTKAKTLQEYNKVNADFSRNLALAASLVSYKLEKFVFVSSLAAIGPITDFNAAINDDTNAQPVTFYGLSKKLAEEYLNKIENLPLVTVRPTAVYGPREKDIFILFKTINQGLEPYIGRFNQTLSFIYVKDLAEIIIRFLTSDVVHKTYNISDGLTYNRYALADGLKKALQKKTLKMHIPLGIIKSLAGLMDTIYARSSKTPTLNKEKIKELTAPNWACNIENLKKDLQFEPQYNLERGLQETVKWYKANNWLK